MTPEGWSEDGPVYTHPESGTNVVVGDKIVVRGEDPTVALELFEGEDTEIGTGSGTAVTDLVDELDDVGKFQVDPEGGGTVRTTTEQGKSVTVTVADDGGIDWVHNEAAPVDHVEDPPDDPTAQVDEQVDASRVDVEVDGLSELPDAIGDRTHDGTVETAHATVCHDDEGEIHVVVGPTPTELPPDMEMRDDVERFGPPERLTEQLDCGGTNGVEDRAGGQGY